MNVYDFDKTIFYTDSGIAFLKWCTRKNPKIVFKYLPKTILYAILYFFKVISVTEATEQLFSYMRYVPNLTEEINAFWDQNACLISAWYLAQKKEDDLIISASPEFFLKPIVEKLNVRVIGTELDPKTGKLSGRSCYGKQKVKNLIKSELFPENTVDEFYSDSLSDFPLALCAEKAFLVVKNGTKVKKWPEITKKISEKIKYLNL